MKPRTLTALACAAALGSPALAHAAAPVEQRRIATTTITLDQGHGVTQDVELRLSTTATGASLAVSVTRCDADGCDYPVDYAGTVTGGTVSAKAASASLNTVVGGRALAVTWKPSDHQAVVTGGIRGSGEGGDDAVSAYHGAPALVTVKLDDAQCTGSGAVGDEVYASDSNGRPAGVRPLSSLRLPAADLTC